ncbi:MAG: sugar nucleotide-binding protein [Azonexus sp.]
MIAQVVASATSARRVAIFLRALHHLEGGECSWHDYARTVVSAALAAGKATPTTPERILPIATADYPTAAKRPANSRMATAKLRETFGLVLAPADWACLHVLQQILIFQEHTMRKGIILAGGSGTRLLPGDCGVLKQLLPIHDKPMIILSADDADAGGIGNILVISTPQDTPRFQQLLLGMAPNGESASAMRYNPVRRSCPQYLSSAANSSVVVIVRWCLATTSSLTRVCGRSGWPCRLARSYMLTVVAYHDPRSGALWGGST